MNPIRTFENRIPMIDPQAMLDPLCLVIGDVHIGANTSLWPGVVVRGDIHHIRIGSDSNIQDGSVLHTDEGVPMQIGANVTVGVMGSGNVKVWARETLDANVMGSGDVRYRGEAKVDRMEAGSGRVRPL